MRITLDELMALEQPVIDLLEILSLEGQRYMARLHFDQGAHHGMAQPIRVISDRAGETQLFKSSWAIQDKLRDLAISRTEIVHSSAYHEMIGLADATIEPMRIRIQGSGQ